MKPLKSKLKPFESKLESNFNNLEDYHPIRDLDTNVIIDKLESELNQRTFPLSKRLKLQK